MGPLFALVLILAAGETTAQDLPVFDGADFGKVVIDSKQSAPGTIRNEAMIGAQGIEFISNYSANSPFARLGRAVAKLDILTDRNKLVPCTAFLVAGNRGVTNDHCVPGIPAHPKTGGNAIAAVRFHLGFVRGGVDGNTQSFDVSPVPLEANEALDYTVPRLLGDANTEFGALELAAVSARDADKPRETPTPPTGGKPVAPASSGWTGLRVQDLDADIAKALGVSGTSGVLVSEVLDGPVRAAGIKAGDVVLEMGGETVTDTRGLVAMVLAHRAGESIVVRLNRAGRNQSVKVTLADPLNTRAEPPSDTSEQVLPSVTLAPIDTGRRREFGLSEDRQGLLVVAVDERSEAWNKGIRPGDVVSGLDHKSVGTLAEAEALTAELRKRCKVFVLVWVFRNGEAWFITTDL
ncbi:PDZ domain-containing protein [Mameliella alba]|uniref:PDZ domain-containing protein n=1 Tax=Mameliella alba TaxID=561184 RepID=UPI001430782A|nr:PDZ domain-containing protein [Mameliella alba]